MLKHRILSGLVLIPVVLGALWLGGWFFTLTVSLFFLVASWEFVTMFSQEGAGVSLALIWAQIGLWLAYGHWQRPEILVTGLPLLLLVSVGEQIFSHQRLQAPIERWALSIAGGLYIGVGGAYLLRTRWMPYGLWWLSFALVIVWSADSAAYFVGRKWGRHKMAPVISPHKSWEGYAAGIVSAVLLGVVAGFLVRFAGSENAASVDLAPWLWVSLGGVLAILTPLGDLFISLLKRQVGAKDTSQLIPGHGGVLDRLDSLLWGGILTWLLVTWMT